MNINYNINYVKSINDIYNSTSNINGVKHKYKTIVDAVERFISYSVKNRKHPLDLKVELSASKRYQFGRENFGLYYAIIFVMFLDEI